MPLTRARAVLVGFAVLAMAPFAYAATRSWFWQHQHSMAPVATAVYLLLLAALLIGRYRWAWLLLAAFYGVEIAGWGFDSHRFAAWHILGFANALVLLVLLTSSPIRDRLRRPMGVRA